MIPIPEIYICRHTEAFAGEKSQFGVGGLTGMEAEGQRYMVDDENHVKMDYLETILDESLTCGEEINSRMYVDHTLPDSGRLFGSLS